VDHYTKKAILQGPTLVGLSEKDTPKGLYSRKDYTPKETRRTILQEGLYSKGQQKDYTPRKDYTPSYHKWIKISTWPIKT
jgi:hypothetical protein